MPVAVHPGLVEAMLDPAFYPHRPDSVELRETHISWVFRAGSLAYKVKKPIVLPFLDYGTAARRREMCKEEVVLNRRLAPDLYRRVVSIVPSGEGYALAEDDDPAAVDYAVEMDAVDEERSLAALEEAGILSASDVEAVGACSPGSTPRPASSAAPKRCAPRSSPSPRSSRPSVRWGRGSSTGPGSAPRSSSPTPSSSAIGT